MLFEFIYDTIIHVELRRVNPQKMKTLDLLKDEFDDFKNNKNITGNILLGVEILFYFQQRQFYFQQLQFYFQEYQFYFQQSQFYF